jgi:hypothetical protein
VKRHLLGEPLRVADAVVVARRHLVDGDGYAAEGEGQRTSKKAPGNQDSEEQASGDVSAFGGFGSAGH